MNSLIYVVTLAVSIIIAFLSKYLRLTKSIQEFGYFISFLPLTILGAIRGYVGIDYYTYSLVQIPEVLAGSNTVKFELLDKFIVFIGYNLAHQQHYFYIFAIFHCVLMYFAYKYVVEQSDDVPLSLFIFVASVYYSFSLSGIRQSIATLIVFYSIKYLKSKRFVHFLICILIASLFHKSSLVYICLILLELFEIRNSIKIILTGISVYTAYIGSTFISDIMKKYNFYSEYIGSKFYNGEFNTTHQLYVLILCSVVMLLALLLGSEQRKKNRIYLNINFIMFLVGILQPILPTPSRVIFMFAPVHIVLIPNLLNEIKSKKIRMFILFFLISFLGIFFSVMVFKRNVYETIPYKTFFEYIN